MDSDALAALMPLVSPRTGLISKLAPMPRSAIEPSNVFVYQADLAHFDFRKAGVEERGAAGKGLTREAAKLGAIGEAIERYCGYHVSPARLRTATYNDIGDDAISPADCVLFSDAQYAQPGFPYPRFDAHAPIAWINGRSLTHQRDIWLPASLVYLNPAEYFCVPTSNGLAAGPTLEFAIANGLYELIERDAFLTTWMNRVPPSRIHGATPAVATIRAQYARSGIVVHSFLLHSDVPVYTVMSIAVNRTGTGPAAVIGLGCHLNPATALQRSVLELCQAHATVTINAQINPPAGRLTSYASVQGLDDHCSFFSLPENLPELSFLLNTESDIALDSLPEVPLVRIAGSHIAYAELTTPDLAEFNIHVVRVLATQLQPIHFGYGGERLGGTRIRHDAGLNRCPHPLA